MVELILKTSSFETPTRLNAMSLPLLPIWIADLLGSALMCIFSLLAVQVARRLRRTDPNNVVWTYLLWLCYALAAFALSRSVGHIVRRLLLTLGYDDLWSSLQPVSGAMNSLLFAVVASFTLFFERVWKIYQEILADRKALQEAHGELLYLNRNLERMVEERTHELSASERKYRRIFETSQDMIMVTEADGLILDMNHAGARMLGVSLTAETVGKHYFKDFFSEQAQWDELVAGLMRDGTVTNEETRLQALDRRSFTALISAKAEQSEPGQALAAIHFLAKDISKRQAMEKQLLLADKLSSIGQLAAGVAHEVNNPLGMILGYTQLLIRGEEAGTQRYDDLRTIEKHTRTCKTIVERLLNFARSTQTRREPGDIHQVIEEVIGLMKRPLELDNILLETDFDSRVPPLPLDKEKMRQVFMNLLVNARQAIGKQGHIRIITRYDTEREEVTIQVMDNGCGIQPENLHRIFDPFFTTKTTGEGTGLGLSVSYGIVQDHKGQILVNSDPGKGSTFSLILPNLAAGMDQKV
jgi:two-component system, NtrC family, sensor kinase